MKYVDEGLDEKLAWVRDDEVVKRIEQEIREIMAEQEDPVEWLFTQHATHMFAELACQRIRVGLARHREANPNAWQGLPKRIEGEQ